MLAILARLHQHSIDTIEKISKLQPQQIPIIFPEQSSETATAARRAIQTLIEKQVEESRGEENRWPPSVHLPARCRFMLHGVSSWDEATQLSTDILQTIFPISDTSLQSKLVRGLLQQAKQPHPVTQDAADQDTVRHLTPGQWVIELAAQRRPLTGWHIAELIREVFDEDKVATSRGPAWTSNKYTQVHSSRHRLARFSRPIEVIIWSHPFETSTGHQRIRQS
jgi:hypothetical protein